MGESVSVVIPVYNSEATLLPLLARLHPILSERGTPFEIILVNDGSKDGSWNVVHRCSETWSNVRGIELTRNYGQHNALLCGIRAACHDVIVTMDDDLQHPPEEIPLLLTELAAGADVVYGTPRREQHGWWRDRASILTKLSLRHILGATIARDVSAFRAFRTTLRESFADYRGSFVSIDVLLAWGTTRFSAVPVRHEPRCLGRSNYNLLKLITHAANLTTGFSTGPLRLASLLGFFVTLFGLAILITVVGRYLFSGSVVPGFCFLASIIAIFSGVQLFSLGIIGEYLARMYYRTLDKPAYVIRREVFDTTQDERRFRA